jgi:hypothetical protein
MPLFSYANAVPIALAVGIFAVALAVWRVYNSRDDGAPLRWGAFLVGRISGTTTFTPDQVETLRNFFIVIAGIGANMLAGAAMMNVGKAKRNRAIFRRYAEKVVFSRAMFGRLFVLTIQPPPERHKPVHRPSNRKPNGKVPPVKH